MRLVPSAQFRGEYLKEIEMQTLQKNRVSGASFAKAAVLAVMVIGAAQASAAAIDVAAVVTDIGAQAAPIGLVGGAVLLIVLAVKAFKWVRSALS